MVDPKQHYSTTTKLLEIRYRNTVEGNPGPTQPKAAGPPWSKHAVAVKLPNLTQ